MEAVFFGKKTSYNIVGKMHEHNGDNLNEMAT